MQVASATNNNSNKIHYYLLRLDYIIIVVTGIPTTIDYYIIIIDEIQVQSNIQSGQRSDRVRYVIKDDIL